MPKGDEPMCHAYEMVARSLRGVPIVDWRSDIELTMSNEHAPSKAIIWPAEDAEPPA